MSDDAKKTARIVLVTGADGGLGRALVREYVAQGWLVVAGFHHTNSHQKTEGIWPLRIDVTNRVEVRQAIAEVLAGWGTIDVLINNAGVTADRLMAQLEEPDWDRVLGVNLKGAFLCSQAVLPGMLVRRNGHIVNVSSVSGRLGRAGQANYAAAKAGLLGLTTALAKEVGSRNVRVNAVLPGVMWTKMVEQLTEEQRQQLISMNALKRVSQADEVARFIVFLTTLQDVSGQCFQLDSRICGW